MRNLLYNLIINDFTNHCYRNCLNYFPNNATILDVGIGNGNMLKTYHSLIKSKCLKITGIDINKIYLKHCIRLIKKNHLEDNLTIYHQPIESFKPPSNGSFDFVLFSMSFMLFKDQPLILEKVKNCLHSDGEIVFFQTMFKERSLLKDFIKPKLKYFTTIDFGKTIYENDFFSLLERHELTISQDRTVTKGCFNGECRMIVAGQEKSSYNSTARRSSQCTRNVLWPLILALTC